MVQSIVCANTKPAKAFEIVLIASSLRLVPIPNYRPSGAFNSAKPSTVFSHP